MTIDKTLIGPIQIDWEADGRVDVVGKDRHRFLMTIQQAAEACARAHEQLVFADEFRRILAVVHRWLRDHAGAVDSAFFAVVDRQMTIFIVPRRATMDFALSDEIARLEIDLYHDFTNARCEVRQIPGRDPDSLSTFLDLDQAIQLYGQRETAPSPVAP